MEFFKPTKLKIFTTIFLLLVIAGFILMGLFTLLIAVGGGTTPLSISNLADAIFVFLLIPTGFPAFGNTFSVVLYCIVLSIVIGGPTYLLACLLVAPFVEQKKQKKVKRKRE